MLIEIYLVLRRSEDSLLKRVGEEDPAALHGCQRARWSHLEEIGLGKESLEGAQRAKELQDQEIFDLEKQLEDVEKAKVEL